MSFKLTLGAEFVITLAALAQSAAPPSINKTTLANGTILLNGRPFPMVLDAGTDSFTPQDYATVMGNKDAWGANTWWLQYSMRHMTSESAGDFSGLSNALDFFERTGVWVNLYIRGEYRDLPSWFSKTYSDYKMLDPDGKPVGTQVCLQHEGFRRLIDHYARGIAHAARNKPSLLMYSTYDEFCIRGWGCWCPRCIRKYREYLKEKYKDVGSLNQRWHTEYASWEKIDAPRTQTFDSNYGDWQRYRLKVLHDFGRLYYTALKEEDPAHLVWIDINMDLYDYTWKRLCLWWNLTDTFDLFNEGPGSYADEAGIRTAMSRAIHDNYGKGATWHRGIDEREYTYKPELYSLLFEGGHGGLVWWYDFWKLLRTDRVWGVAEGENSAAAANWFASGELNHLAQYLGDLYVNSKPVRGKVALFVSGETDMLRSVTDKQALDRENPTNLEGLTQMLRDVNIPYEAIGEDQLDQLSTFSAVMVGQFAMCAGERTIKAFREYVRHGGLLIATNHAFSADDNGKEIANPAFGLEELWGSSGNVDDVAEDGVISAVAGNPLPGIPAGMQFPALGGVARRKLGAAQLIARLADGTPAITLNRYCTGSVLFLGTNAGEAYNYGHLLSMGRYRLPRGQKLEPSRYSQLVQRYDGWRNYALLMQAALKRAGVESPVTVATSDTSDLRNIARASLQEQRNSPDAAPNHLLIVTLEPAYNPTAEIAGTPEHPAKAQPRTLRNLVLTAIIPEPTQVQAVYRIPSLGYAIGKIDAVPARISFKVVGNKLRIAVPEISEAACFLIARSAGPLVGVRTEHISTVQHEPTRVTVTVDNAAATPITGKIAFPNTFRAVPVDGGSPKFVALRPSQRHSATFDVYALGPIESNRTFSAHVQYYEGRVGRVAESYPITSWTGERMAHGWLARVEAAMTDAATAPGTPHGDLYGEALQKREFVYAAYNKGDWAETARLARQSLVLCEQLRAARLRGHNEPDPE